MEIVAAAAVLAMVAAWFMPRNLQQARRARRSACYVTIEGVNVQVARWHRDRGSWPADSLADIGADREYFPEGIPQCPVDGSSYVLDPRTHRVAPHSH